MGEGWMEGLEARRMFAVDFSVSFAPLNNEIPRYVLPGNTTKFKSQIVIANEGSALPKNARPADVQFVLRPVGGGNDIVVGSLKGTILRSLKPNQAKLFNQTITIRPNTIPEADYRLTLNFDGDSIGDTQPGDNTSILFNNLTTVTANPPGPLDVYGLGTRITFTKTGVSDGHGIAGTVHEIGNFVDSRGRQGTYDAVIQGPRIPLPGLLKFRINGLTGPREFFLDTKKLRTLNGVTLEFTVESKGAVGFVQKGQEGVVYFRRAK